MRTLPLVALMVLLPAVLHGQVASTIQARARVVNARPSQEALLAAARLADPAAVTTGSAQGLALVRGRLPRPAADRPGRVTHIEISFLRN